MKILLFRTAPEKEEKIRELCKKQGIQLSKVPRKDYGQAVNRRDYGQKIGTLAEISGFHKNGKIYNGPDFAMEMLVFSGMDSEQLDAFLKDYRESGIPPIGCKGILTPNNVFWTAEELFRELWKEHLTMNPLKRG